MAQTKIEQGLLKFTEATDYLKIPTGTTAQRPSSPVNGYIRFNTTINDVEAYNGTEWTRMGIAPPTFTSVDYPGSVTALDPAGDESLVINGTNFNTGIAITIEGTTPSSIIRNSSTQLTITTPAKTAGTYDIVFTNTDGGTATATNAVSYNGIPAFTHNAGSLGVFTQGATVNVSVVATEPDGGAITHTITSGSLPSGLSLNATTGAITGTVPDVSASTTSSFTITATDNENQSTSRAYSIQVNPILPSDDFNVLTYTGNGGTQTITGLSFQPDFVWLKKRNADNEQLLIHPNVGIGEYYRPSYASAGRDVNSSRITALNNNGFTLGGDGQVNNNNDTYVAYCWKVNGGTIVSNTDGTTNSSVQVNAEKGISMITYSGAGADRTVGHGLGKVPELFFMMDRYNGGGWRMWHKDLDNADKYLEMGTGGQQTSGSIWSGEKPTSSVFHLGNVVPPNGSGRAHVCWAFTSIDKHSKFSSYIGNGSSAGPIVNLGFKPAFLIIRRIDAGDHFYMFDNKRQTSNPRNVALFMNTSIPEAQGNLGTGVDFLSNGFQVTSTDSGINANSGKYIYMAWAADPDATTPTLADSFSTVAYTGNSSTQSIEGLGFSPNLVWIKGRNNTYVHGLYDTIRGPLYRLRSNGTNANELVSAGTTGADSLISFDSDGFTLGSDIGQNQSGNNYVAWAWKADDDEPTITLDEADISARAVYTFESNANDVTTNYNATASGITYSSGKFGNAATYSGTNASSGSKIYVSNSVYGSSTSVFSVSLWIKCTNTSGEIPIAGNGGTIGGTKGYALYLNSGFVALTFRSSNGNEDFYYGDRINDNAWHHLVLTFNNGEYALYKDGIEHIAGTTTNFLNNTTPSFDTYFGNRWNRNESGVIAGQIDQIRIYDGPLTAASVTALYNESTSQNSTLNIGTKEITSIKSIVSENANAGFSIVKWTGDGVQGSKVPHGLSVAPELIIMKDLSATNHWVVGNSSSGWTKAMHLDLTNADNASDLYWDDTAPTSTVFSLGHHSTAYNVLGNEYIAYCFHSVSGYSKIGSYTGTAGALTVTTGFQPDFLMVKNATTAGYSWYILDSVRGGSGGYMNRFLAAEDSQAETEVTNGDIDVTFTSTGFQYASTMSSTDGFNKSGDTYIYMAFKIN